MEKYIPLDALVVEIERLEKKNNESENVYDFGTEHALKSIRSFINTLEVKDVNLIIYTIIAECCDWLAINTELSHYEIEGCRNLMLTIKEEQLKARKE